MRRTRAPTGLPANLKRLNANARASQDPFNIFENFVANNSGGRTARQLYHHVNWERNNTIPITLLRKLLMASYIGHFNSSLRSNSVANLAKNFSWNNVNGTRAHMTYMNRVRNVNRNLALPANKSRASPELRFQRVWKRIQYAPRAQVIQALGELGF